MTEAQIRDYLKETLPGLLRVPTYARLVEEMEICGGRARADIAYVADRLIGIEIKGPQDSLERLSAQVKWYSKCFDIVLLAVHEALATDATGTVPAWWGILVISADAQEVLSYRLVRRPRKNPNLDTNELLGLLWRQEIEALYLHLLNRPPPSRASKKIMREQLLAATSRSDLKAAGMELLCSREGWRFTS